MNLIHVVSHICNCDGRLDTVKHQREIMQQELKKATLKTLSAEEKAHKLDQLLAEEEGEVASIEKEISIAQEKHFKKAEELKAAKRLQQNKEAEIQVKTSCLTLLNVLYLCTCNYMDLLGMIKT